jgi:hypothetical protein
MYVTGPDLLDSRAPLFDVGIGLAEELFDSSLELMEGVHRSRRIEQHLPVCVPKRGVRLDHRLAGRGECAGIDAIDPECVVGLLDAERPPPS